MKVSSQMRNRMRAWIIALPFLMLLAVSVRAQDITGDWQGILKGNAQAQDLKLILHIIRSNDGAFNAIFFNISQKPVDLDGILVNSVTLSSSDFKFSIDSAQASYEGKLSADGNSINGTWKVVRPLPLTFQRATKETAWPYSSAPHTASRVTVDKDVSLEVLDFGGSGRPMIFLAGLGATAHVFDQFAPKFIQNYHVYGITRRGYGASSAPVPANGNYSADRLGDDILAVIDRLKLERPVLVGHSIAGEELSSIGSRHPEKVAGLIYLDAGYAYAYYDRSRGDIILQANDLKKKLDDLILSQFGASKQDPTDLANDLLQNSLPQMAKDIEEDQKQLKAMSDLPKPPAMADVPAIGLAIIQGEQKYTNIRVPILAFFAAPHAQGEMFKDKPDIRARLEAMDIARMDALIKSFETGLPSARVVRLAHADHFVIATHEADVLREMNAFLSKLR